MEFLQRYIAPGHFCRRASEKLLFLFPRVEAMLVGWISASISGHAALLTRFASMVIRSRKCIWMRPSTRNALPSRRTGDGTCEDSAAVLGFSDFVILGSWTRLSGRLWGWGSGVKLGWMGWGFRWYFLLGAQCSALCLSFGIFSRVLVVLLNSISCSHSPTDCLCSDTR